ncbi:MAG: hypothetical protein AAF215_35395 [Cyanobacteria bacterium P01_A01_bin.123]
MVVNLLLSVVSWFRKLWDRLDEKTKRKIIDTVVKAFEELLRAFYREWKDKQEK